MFEDIVENIQLYFLIFARILGLLRTAPLLSSEAVPQTARNALALLTAFIIFPWVFASGYPIPDSALQYGAIVAGEILLGIITGFFLTLIFATFQLSAQYFSLQMGFGAAEVFDPLSQVEIPVMGQFLNLIAMYIFIATGGFGKVFLVGIYRSFQAMRAWDLVAQREFLFTTLTLSVGRLFEQALVISLPILGTLFLVQVTLGLLAKAAPQMNLLVLGFPISTSVAFTILFLSLPFIAEAFATVIDQAYAVLLELFDRAWRTGR